MIILWNNFGFGLLAKILHTEHNPKKTQFGRKTMRWRKNEYQSKGFMSCNN